MYIIKHRDRDLYLKKTKYGAYITTDMNKASTWSKKPTLALKNMQYSQLRIGSQWDRNSPVIPGSEFKIIEVKILIVEL